MSRRQSAPALCAHDRLGPDRTAGTAFCSHYTMEAEVQIDSHKLPHGHLRKYLTCHAQVRGTGVAFATGGERERERESLHSSGALCFRRLDCGMVCSRPGAENLGVPAVLSAATAEGRRKTVRHQKFERLPQPIRLRGAKRALEPMLGALPKRLRLRELGPAGSRQRDETVAPILRVNFNFHQPVAFQRLQIMG